MYNATKSLIQRGCVNGLEKKFRESNAKSSYVINIADYDDNARYLIGWPGYRTAHNKSGLGYMETQAEIAHMQSVMLRWLVTGKFRTRNPFFLLAMTLFGIFCGGFPTIVIIHDIVIEGNWLILQLPLVILRSLF